MKINKYISVILLTVLFFSCSEDFLVKAPMDSVNTANFWQTESDAIAAINGAYQPLQSYRLYNLRMWCSDIFAGNSIVGAAGGSDGIETQNLANFVTATDNQGVLDMWRGPWPGILRCNLVLKNVPGMNLDENIKKRILGEAYFLRAHYYFILVQYFGDIPLITEPQNPNDNLLVPRISKDEVYKQIISDFENAIDLLPSAREYSGTDIGRASKGSAEGMLAKVFLTLSSLNAENNWQRVVDLCNSVASLGHTLNPDYANNFDPLNKNTAESLFEIQYSGSTTYDFGSYENQASYVSTFIGPRGANMVAGGYGWNQPTQEFVNAYEVGDLRKDKTILYDGCPPFDGKEYSSSYSISGFNLRKFLVPKSIASAYNNNPSNFPVLRYADVLLMKAEALNELGKSSQAENALNEVRARAGLGSVIGLSKDNFREKVLHERRMELAFEGQRWFDLIRINKGQYAIDFLHSIGKSNMNQKFLLLPIPQMEIDKNPNLSQNPGY
ncbi:MAG TPA: RagB/SusD family nutrient uptake outer membrane protein [Prolixibacteraceae bacterium]|nr:RagB/SusD family nutrient uptake outer membrane protein [Prolixibacteraceae bacterium]